MRVALNLLLERFEDTGVVAGVVGAFPLRLRAVEPRERLVLPRPFIKSETFMNVLESQSRGRHKIFRIMRWRLELEESGSKVGCE